MPPFFWLFSVFYFIVSVLLFLFCCFCSLFFILLLLLFVFYLIASALYILILFPLLSVSFIFLLNFENDFFLITGRISILLSFVSLMKLELRNHFHGFAIIFDADVICFLQFLRRFLPVFPSLLWCCKAQTKLLLIR